MSRVVLFLVMWAATANAAPPSRVLVADPDPELVHAINTSLAPWKIVVVAEPKVPDEAHAHARADAVDAQFIVWRERDQLVVFDREQGTSERRTARAGAFDPVSAAAAALTVKTMLRLPPLPPTTEDDGTIGVVTGPVAPPAASGPELRMQVGIGARLARGSQTDIGGRALLAVLVRPTPTLGLRLGIAGDLNTSSDVSKAGFKGTWSDWAVLAVASWTGSVGSFEIGPTLGVGVSRSHLDGDFSMTPRTETSTLPIVRGGVSIRWPLGAWSFGASLDADLVLGTPTYTREMGMGNPTTFFEVPGFSAVFGVFAAAELGR
jgi:hypothetical protein